ncbi:MAG: M14 metallopeptidase family protein [Bryobacteraceae bacterium]
MRLTIVRGWMRLALAAIFALHLAWGAPPTPAAHFGESIGRDGTVLDWDKVVSYFQELEKSSGRIKVHTLGQTTGGRPLIAAFISDETTLKNLDRYQANQKKLADPRRTLPAAAEQLIARSKAVVAITCSIHSNELASTHTATEWAYRLITQDTPKLRAIRANVILILVPSLNPDGVDLVTRWYRRTYGTQFEGTTPPELYQKYVGHDNNRDWYMFTQIESRLVAEQVFNRWLPQIVYDVHQMGQRGARMFVPPWIDPIEPNIDPIIAQECNMVGTGIAADLTAAGKPGVLIHALFDYWTPGRHYQSYHGGLRILSESASARLASPVQIAAEQLDPRESSWNYLEPWPGGQWRLRDIMDYQLIAMESVAFQAAARREDFLRNFYRIHQRAVSRKTPYAFVVPATQRDPGATRKLLETLSFGLVEIDRAEAPFTAGGKHYPAASHVIRLAQPYGAYAKALLERQRYPDLRQYPGGPPKRPYDVTAHTLPLLMGVEVDTIAEPFAARMTRAASFAAAPSLAAPDTEAWRGINRAWNAGSAVYRDMSTGDFYTGGVRGRNVKQIARPRIGLYKGFVPNIDEGWTRWVLEQFGFAYTSLGNREIQHGGLRQSYDAIVFADQSATSITEGYRAVSMPPEYCGGLAENGAAALKEFLHSGGTLVFFNEATEYAFKQLGVPVKGGRVRTSNRDLYCPGSLLRVKLKTWHPLTLGLPEEIAIWMGSSPVWEVEDSMSVARYPQSGILDSGWLLGERHLAGHTALADVPYGAGHVILFGMRPQYRGQSYQTFKLFFNALLGR